MERGIKVAYVTGYLDVGFFWGGNWEQAYADLQSAGLEIETFEQEIDDEPDD